MVSAKAYVGQTCRDCCNPTNREAVVTLFLLARKRQRAGQEMIIVTLVHNGEEREVEVDPAWPGGVCLVHVAQLAAVSVDTSELHLAGKPISLQMALHASGVCAEARLHLIQGEPGKFEEVEKLEWWSDGGEHPARLSRGGFRTTLANSSAHAGIETALANESRKTYMYLLYKYARVHEFAKSLHDCTILSSFALAMLSSPLA